MDGGGWEFLERLAAPAFLVGPDLAVLAANAAAREAFGAEGGKACPRIWGVGEEACPSCPLKRAADTGLPFGGAAPHPGRGASPLLVLAVPFGGERGAPVLVVAREGPSDGIEERADGPQAAFVGSITHALKGALNSLEGGLFFLESGHRSGNPSRVEAGMAMARRGIWNARSLVANVLTWARPRELHREEVGGASLASSALEAFGRRPGAGPVELVVPQGPEVRCSGDRPALEAMLLCLLEVCREAAGASGQVRLRVGTEGGGAVFEAAHTGTPCGVQTLAGALGPRYRPNGADRSGLWLHAARRIAAAHGGTLEVRAKDGEEVFRVRLPEV